MSDEIFHGGNHTVGTMACRYAVVNKQEGGAGRTCPALGVTPAVLRVRHLEHRPGVGGTSSDGAVDRFVIRLEPQNVRAIDEVVRARRRTDGDRPGAVGQTHGYALGTSAVLQAQQTTVDDAAGARPEGECRGAGNRRVATEQ